LQAVYLRDTTYLRTPSLGIIPVVTLFVVCAGAVVVSAKTVGNLNVNCQMLICHRF